MNLLFLIGIAGCVVLAIMAAIANRRMKPDQSAADLNWTESLLGLAAAFSVRTVSLLLLMRNGLELVTFDEPIRWRLGWGWSNRPYFFTSWDMIWLPGQLALTGTLDKFLHNSLVAIQIGSLLSQALTIAGVFYLAYVLSRRRWIGTLAALLAAIGYPLLWMGMGPLAETVIGGTFLFAMACIIRFAQSRIEGRNGMRYLAAGALLITVTTSFHFIAWVAVFVGICFLIPLALIYRRQIGKAFWPAAVLVAIAASIIPLLWVLGSWHYLHAPLQFLRNQNHALQNANHFGAQGTSLLFKAMLYPNELFVEIGVLAPLIICGVFMGGPGAATRRWITGFTAAYFIVMEIQATFGNVGHVYFRSLVIVYLLFIVSACISLLPLLDVLRGGIGPGARRLAWSGLTLMLFGWIGTNAVMANRFENHGDEVAHDMVAMGKWLMQETRHSREIPGFGPGKQIGIFSEASNSTRMAYLAYTAGCPERLKAIPDKQFNQGKLDGLDYVFVYASPKQPPPGWEMFNQFGRWKLYRASKKEAKK